MKMARKFKLTRSLGATSHRHRAGAIGVRQFSCVAAAVLLSGAILVPADRALAQTVEQRLDELDRKYDDILSILNELRNAQSPEVAQLPGAAATPAAQTRYRAGFQHLDVYTPKNVEADNLPTGPVGVAAASSTTEAGELKFGAYTNIPETKHLASYEGPILISHSSLYQVETDGDYTFVLSPKVDGRFRAGNIDCQAYLSIEGKTIVKVPFRFKGFGQAWSDQGSARLSKGYYQMDLGVACEMVSTELQERLTVSLAVAEPGNRAAGPIQPERLVIEE